MPILFQLTDDLPVYTSTILIGLGGTIGLAWISWQTPAELRVRYLDAGLLSLLGAMIGGRLAFVLTNWPYFQVNSVEIPLIYLGGFSWFGAFLGGLLALLLSAALFKQPLGALADALLPLLGTLAISAWLGCWLDGCAYGETTEAWWGIPAKDEWGIVSTRVPIQLLGALSAAALIGLLTWGATHRLSPGVIASLGIFGISLIMLILSFLRADPSQNWQGLRLGSWASFTALLLAGVALIVAILSGTRNQPNSSNQELSNNG